MHIDKDAIIKNLKYEAKADFKEIERLNKLIQKLEDEKEQSIATSAKLSNRIDKILMFS